jgi:solute carrier family 25 (adenine nucleotide translocator) protein 4/5/6/31
MTDMVLGGVSGAIVKTGMAPIERVKLLLQTQDSNPKIISGEEPRYTGIGDCFKRVHAEQGMNAFWRGNLVNCIRYAPQQGSALAFNDAIKRFMPKYSPKTDYYKDFGVKLFSGGAAGGVANVVCYPFDFARTRLASDVGSGKKTFNGIADCIMKTIKMGGVTGLYRGSAVTVAGAFVYRGGQLGLFGQIMDANPYKADKGILGIVAAFTCATVARTITTPFNYPFDTVRRRMMLDSEKPAAERLYSSGVNCFFKVMQNEGAGGMYKGLIPELFRGIGGPMVLTAYDRIKLVMGL